MTDDPEHLRARAVRLFGMAIQARDFEPSYADKLVAEAIELQERATTMEEDAVHGSEPPDESQPTAQQPEQAPPEKDEA